MSAPITLRCPGCNARIKAPKEILGQTRKCPGCGSRVHIKIQANDEGPAFVLSTPELDIESTDSTN